MRCWKGTCVHVEQLRELACGVLELEHLLDSGYDEHDGQGEAAGCGAGMCERVRAWVQQGMEELG